MRWASACGESPGTVGSGSSYRVPRMMSRRAASALCSAWLTIDPSREPGCIGTWGVVGGSFSVHRIQRLLQFRLSASSRRRSRGPPCSRVLPNADGHDRARDRAEVPEPGPSAETVRHKAFTTNLPGRRPQALALLESGAGAASSLTLGLFLSLYLIYDRHGDRVSYRSVEIPTDR
jgi:hypothetical protein